MNTSLIATVTIHPDGITVARPGEQPRSVHGLFNPAYAARGAVEQLEADGLTVEIVWADTETEARS